MSLTIIRGDTNVINTTVYTTEDMTAAQDLTACTGITFTLRRRNEAGVIICQKTLTDGVAVVSAVNGTIRITLDPDDTEAEAAVRAPCVYDIETVWTGGAKYTVETGQAVLVPDVTYA